MPDTKKVLVIDDEPDIRTGVGMWLKSAGYEIGFAETGETGLESAKAEQPDAILLDMLMPGIDGIETLRQLRMDDGTQQIPVVMLSASLRDEQHALDAGARFFIKKPYRGKEVVETIDATLAET